MKNGRYWLDYLQHLLKANTRHGTHSPFVYRLLDEVVYPRRRAGEPRDKTERLVSRLRNRFAPNRRAADLDGAQKQRDTDFIVLDNISHTTVDLQRLSSMLPQMHAGSVLVVLDIYRRAARKRLWQRIQTMPGVTITIDFFRVGLVFFHQGQAPQNFKIRY